MKMLITLFTVLFAAHCSAQYYSGPATGSVPAGVTVNTSSFNYLRPLTEPVADNPANPKYRPEDEPPVTYDSVLLPEEFRRFYEIDLSDNNSGGAYPVFSEFSGIPYSSKSPADASIAAGPAHIVAAVNSMFRIYDKEGNVLSEIRTKDWYSSLVSQHHIFDPKVIYDHFSNRWVMIWAEGATHAKSDIFISVSDDGNPLGLWYNWALPGNRNGTEYDSTWADFPGLGFDDKAIYVCTNQFSDAGAFKHAKLRIIPKSNLYAGSPGAVQWTDFWQISSPSLTVARYAAFSIRPTIFHSTRDSVYYFLWANNSGSRITLYTLTNPVTKPVLKPNLIQVDSYEQVTGLAKQKDLSTRDVEAGTSHFKTEAVFLDGKIHAAHATKFSNTSNSSGIRYYEVDTDSLKLSASMSWGSHDLWLFYPAVSVDKHGNVMVFQSFCGPDHYLSTLYVPLKKEYPLTWNGSKILKLGLSSYSSYGNVRNRWGDYQGISLDPSDRESFWIMGDYATGPSRWDTYIGKVRVAPSIQVDVPKEGTIFPIGNTMTIGWKASGVSFVKIEYTTNNGLSWQTIAASVPSGGTKQSPDSSGGGSNQYSWLVPNTPSTQCKIRISSTSNITVSSVSNGNFIIKPVPVTNLWSVWFNHNASTYPNSPSNSAVVFLPNVKKFWTSRISSDMIHIWNMNGQLEDSVRLIGLNGITHLAFDGNDVIAANNTSSLYRISTLNKKINGTISLPSGLVARVAAYSPDGDEGRGSYWIGNNSSGYLALRQISLTGQVISSTNLISISAIRGIAYDNWSDNGPFLWVWDRSSGIGVPQKIHQVSVASGLLTGIEHDVLSDVGFTVPGATAGGLFISDRIQPGKVLLGGILQGSPNRLFAYEVKALAIENPTVTVIAPNSKETLEAGSQYFISWRDENIDRVRIEYSTNGGLNWNLIVTGYLSQRPESPNTDNGLTSGRTASFTGPANYFAWTVPETPSDNCLLKISSADNPAISDTSNQSFRIIEPDRTVTLFSEDFNASNSTGELAARGWICVNADNGGNTLFFTGQPAMFPAFEGPDSGYVAANYQGANSTYINQWLISPLIGVSAGDTLSFYHRSPNGSQFHDSFYVKISPTGSSSIADFTISSQRFKASTAGWAKLVYVVPVSATVRFAIQYLLYNGGVTGNYSDYIGFDKFTVKGIPQLTQFQGVKLAFNGSEFEKDTVSIGFHPEASDAVDPALGESALIGSPPPLGIVYAHLVLPVNPVVMSKTDIRKSGTDSVLWQIIFQYGPEGNPLVLSWNPAQLPAGIFSLLSGDNGSLIVADMKAVSQTTLSNPNITSLKIVYKRETCVSRGLWNGWNLVSVPLSADSMQVGNVFPTVTSAVFGFQNGYQPVTSLEPGAGYWAKFSGSQQVSFCGRVVATQTVNALQGWNIIGAFDRPVPVQRLSSTPPGIISTPLYGFNGSYILSDTLQPGHGYWVKLSSNGTINFTGSVQDKQLAGQISTQSGTLTLTDNSGKTASLVIGEEGEQYEMPPLPLDGLFDVRFSDGYRASLLNSWTTVRLQGLVFPVKVSVTGCTVRYRFGNKHGEMSDESSLLITDAGVSEIHVTKPDIPNEFRLSQNYPNPFNNSSLVSFSIPRRTTVNITVYTLLGEVAAHVWNQETEPGYYEVPVSSDKLASGVYFYELTAKDGTLLFRDVKKLVVLK